MIIKEITDITPAVNDILQLECGDFMLEASIVELKEDGIVIELDNTGYQHLNEGLLSFLKSKTENLAGNSGLESIGYIIGVDRAIGDKFQTITQFVGRENMMHIGRAMQMAGETQDLTANETFVKGFQDGVRDAREGDQDYLRKMVLSKLNRLKSVYKMLDEAEYQGRKVTLNKPMKGDVKKSKVYVKGPKGNVVKVNFGDKNMKIKKSNPARRKSFRARHNCANPGPKWKARYWSCRAW